jgi:hypothetical protein
MRLHFSAQRQGTRICQSEVKHPVQRITQVNTINSEPF